MAVPARQPFVLNPLDNQFPVVKEKTQGDRTVKQILSLFPSIGRTREGMGWPRWAMTSVSTIDVANGSPVTPPPLYMEHRGD